MPNDCTALSVNLMYSLQLVIWESVFKMTKTKGKSPTSVTVTVKENATTKAQSSKQAANKSGAKRGSGTSRRRPGQKVGQKNSQRMPNCDWAVSLRDPFNHVLNHIPDDRCQPSGLVKFRLYGKQNFAGQSSTSTTHSGGFIIAPDPIVLLTTLVESVNGDGYLTDILANGEGWVSNFPPQPVPNATSLTGASNGSATVRFVSIGAKFAYLGTELNRSGRWIVGMINNSASVSQTVATTGTQLSLLSSLTGLLAPNTTVTAIEQSMIKAEEHKISGNSELIVRWKPSSVPTYQVMNTGSGTAGAENYPMTTTGGAASNKSYFSVPPGACGIQAGIGCLVVMFDGDTTAAASAQSNVYSYDIEGIMEVCPGVPQGVTFDLEESPYNPTKLASALHTLAILPCSQQGF
jgi:hypothetical protein